MRVAALLSSGNVRLLTLTGPGGVGKTRLALAVAREIENDASDGVAFVDLSPLTNVDLIPSFVARSLGLRESDRPVADQVTAFLRLRHLLLVLDNCEHVLGGAADLVASLLAECPSVQVLATSRAPLRLRSEREYPVPPLALPRAETEDLHDLAQVESIALFVERTLAVDPSFTLTTAKAPAVLGVCARLEGLPLALELAAARGKVLPPQALLDRLSRSLALLSGGPRDAPQRQQTIRDTIAWSYDLLAPSDQALFRRLAVFAGGFTLETAETVAEATAGQLAQRPEGEGDDLDGGHWRSSGPLDLLDGIESLVDQSLVRRIGQSEGEPPAAPRFAMLETIRAYGLEQLEASGEAAAARDAHAAFWSSWVQSVVPSLTVSADDEQWWRRLDAEHDNIRAAMAWLARSPDPEPLLRVSTAMAVFWLRSGNLRECMAWLRRTLERESTDPIRVETLRLAGETARGLGDHGQAIAWLETSLALARQLGDVAAAGRAVLNLGLVAEMQGNDAGAVSRFQEALALAREADDQQGVANALVNLADAAYRQGDFALSTTLSAEALTASRAIGDAFLTALALSNLGQLAVERGEADEARGWFLEALALARRADNGWLIADALTGLAAAVALRDQPALAARWLGAVHACLAAIGTTDAAHHGLFARTESTVRARLSVADFTAAWTAGEQLSLDRAVREATDPAVMTSPALPGGPAGGRRAGSGYNLTEREVEVLRLLVAGQSNPQIAEALYISPRTATTHVTNILTKLGVSTRTAAATTALAAGLVTLESQPSSSPAT
jgi:predicted ATPase/DNA-binding CsgD family transcriptional regulator